MRLCKDTTALLISLSTVIQNWVGVEKVFARANAVEIYKASSSKRSGHCKFGVLPPSALVGLYPTKDLCG